jgi:hypothetical protein
LELENGATEAAVVREMSVALCSCGGSPADVSKQNFRNKAYGEKVMLYRRLDIIGQLNRASETTVVNQGCSCRRTADFDQQLKPLPHIAAPRLSQVCLALKMKEEKM